jgi:hypothetical protein
MSEQSTASARRERRPVSASVTEAAATFEAEPPTPEEMARTQGAQVVLEPDGAAAAGARGVYPDIDRNTLLRNAGYAQMGLNPHDPSGELTDPEAPPVETPPAPEGGAAPTNVDVPFRGTGRYTA